MLGFCPLASGSKGNCIYLGTPETKILIDAGISGKAIKERLHSINVCLSEIDAVVISHEHTDHIQGLKVLSYRKGIPIFANKGCATAIADSFGTNATFKIFTTGEPFSFKDLHIHPFSIQHDTADPVAFVVETSGIKIGFCTDLGFVTSLVRSRLKGCDYLYLESNHEPNMVHACPRPHVYKQRVLGRSGHLSNKAAAELVQQIACPKLKHIHLAHLSEECNNPNVAKETMENALKDIAHPAQVSVAYQHKPSTPIIFETAMTS